MTRPAHVAPEAPTSGAHVAPKAPTDEAMRRMPGMAMARLVTADSRRAVLSPISRRATRSVAKAVIGLVLIAGTARAQEEFGQTRLWRSGLIDSPTAWGRPVTGDFSLKYSGSSYQTSARDPQDGSSRSSKLGLNTSLCSRR